MLFDTMRCKFQELIVLIGETVVCDIEKSHKWKQDKNR